MDGYPGAIRLANPVRDFKECLDWSEKSDTTAQLRKFYLRVFPDAVDVRGISGNTRKGLALQKGGSDKEIVLANGRVLRIEEKIRNQWYGDILIEWEHRYPSGYIKPGWGQKALGCDILAYVVLPIQHVWLFPWPLLRMALVEHGKAWWGEHKRVAARNRDYTTWSFGVRPYVLLSAIQEQLAWSLGAPEEPPF
jgi:hypothetical protein